MGDVESISSPTQLITSVKSVSCGYHHLAVITYDGKILTTGDNDYGQLGRDGDQKQFLEVTINEELFVPRLVSCGGQVRVENFMILKKLVFAKTSRILRNF